VDTKEQLHDLLNKYLDRKCTKEEIKQLLAYFELPQNETALKAVILQYFENASEEKQNDETKEEKVLRDVHARLITEIGKYTPYSRIKQLQWFKISAIAATILVFFSISIYFYLNNQLNQPQSVAQIIKQDIKPGGNKAILTLSNGQQIVLSDVKNGQLAQQGNIIIHKTKDGLVIYSSTSDTKQTTKANAIIAYNIISTPRGGQYQVILPDGSHVWLNAASSIKYPTTFAGNTRKVEITGEAYFEVAHNATKPFSVITNGQTVQVLGTHFNINAYDNEETIKTTLLEGSVRVMAKNNIRVLKPGEQSKLSSGGELKVNEANLAEAVAWKNGLFYFENSSLQNVMHQLARWYEVEIVYEGKIPDKTFTGKIHRDVNLSEVLEILKFTKVTIKVDGKKIIVTP
jgi:hypothetical protein